MKDRIKNVNKDKIYTIRTEVKLGQYDFENGYFPLEQALTDNIYFHVDPENIESYEKHSMHFPYRFKVFLNNADRISGMSMSKENAQAFVNQRKSTYGTVNRSVILQLNIKIVTLADPEDGAFKADIVDSSFDITTL